MAPGEVFAQSAGSTTGSTGTVTSGNTGTGGAETNVDASGASAAGTPTGTNPGDGGGLFGLFGLFGLLGFLGLVPRRLLVRAKIVRPEGDVAGPPPFAGASSDPLAASGSR